MRARLLGLIVSALIIPTAVHLTDNVDSRTSAAKRMIKDLSGLGVHKVYVPDFCDGPSSPNARGAFFAATFSDLLAAKAKGFKVVSRVDAHRILLQHELTDCDLARPDILSKFSSEIAVDSILSVNLSVNKDFYFIDFVLRDLSGKESSRSQYSEPHDGLTEALFPATASSSGWPFYFPTHDGVTQPKGLRMHPAPYPDGLKDRISGLVIVSALITADGRIEQVRVVQKLKPDIDSAVIDTMKTWVFEPAKAPDGTPIPVRVPLQMSYSF